MVKFIITIFKCFLWIIYPQAALKEMERMEQATTPIECVSGVHLFVD